MSPCTIASRRRGWPCLSHCSADSRSPFRSQGWCLSCSWSAGGAGDAWSRTPCVVDRPRSRSHPRRISRGDRPDPVNVRFRNSSKMLDTPASVSPPRTNMHLVRGSPHPEELGGPLHEAGPVRDPAESPLPVPDPPASLAPAASLESHVLNVNSSGTGRGPSKVPRPTLPREFYRGQARARRAALLAAFLVVGAFAGLAAAGLGSSAAVADGIRMCADPFGDGTRGADIISVSLGSKAPLFVATDVTVAAQWALDRGVFLVGSAGNDGGMFDDGDVENPAVVSLAIAVGAVDASSRIAPFSSIGSSVNRTDPNLKPEVTAPGVQLISTAPGAHYVTTTGTSGATAVATGIVALLLQAHPELRPGRSVGSANVLTLKWALARSASTAPGQAIPHDSYYGYGVIDGLRALSYL